MNYLLLQEDLLSKSMFSLHFLSSASVDGMGKALLTFPLSAAQSVNETVVTQSQAASPVLLLPEMISPGSVVGVPSGGTIPGAPHTWSLSCLMAAGRLGFCSIS